MANIIEITDFAAPELDIYARYSEVQLLRINEPKPGIFIAESPKVVERALDAGYEPISMLVEHKHIETQAKELIARCGDIPVYTADKTDRIRTDAGNAVRHETADAANSRGSLQQYAADRCFGKCRQSHQCWRDFSFGSGITHGCGASDTGMQQSVVPQSHAGEHGNRISGALDDISGKRKMAGRWHGKTTAAWI